MGDEHWPHGGIDHDDAGREPIEHGERIARVISEHC
jgi:hypothetical protein